MKNITGRQLITLNLALFFLMLPVLFRDNQLFDFLRLYEAALITFLALIPHFFGESCFTIYAGWLFSMIVITLLYYWICTLSKLKWKYFFFFLSIIGYSTLVLIFNIIVF